MSIRKLIKPPLNVQQAILFGLLLFIGQHHLFTIPLIAWPSLSYQTNLIFWTKTVTITLLLIFTDKIKNGLKITFVLSLFFILLIVNYNYSGLGAFIPVLGLVFFYQILIDQTKRRLTQKLSQIILFSIFTFSAIHKMNQNYLNGSEFVFQKPFLMRFYNYWPENIVYQLLQQPWIPSLTILIELFIGLLFLIRIRWASFLSLIFLLTLTALHHEVNFVFVLSVALLSNLDPKISYWLNNNRYSQIFQHWLTWYFIIGLWSVLPKSMPWYVGFHLPLTFLLLIGVFYIYKKLARTKSSVEFKIKKFLHPKALALASILTIYFLLGYKHLPSPFGFTMFSGRIFTNNLYKIEISSGLVCKRLLNSKLFARSLVTETIFLKKESDQCWILFPTVSGLKFVERMICDNVDSKAQFYYTPKNLTEKVEYNCSQQTDPTK